MDVKIETLEKYIGDTSPDLGEIITEKKLHWKKEFIFLKKRRLASDLCEYCQKKFNSGSEQDRIEKDCHIK